MAQSAVADGFRNEIELSKVLSNAAALLPTLDASVMASVLSPSRGLDWTASTGLQQPNRAIRMASVGKTFTAATIFRLIELGQLSLDTTLDQVVSEPAANLLRDDGYAIESITIEQLLLLHLNDLGIGVWLESGAAPPNGAIPIARSFFGTTELTGLDFSIDGFGGGGLAGTTTDIAVFYDALLHGRLFDRSSTLDAMLAVPPTNLGIEEFGVLLGDGARGLYRLDLAGVECWAHRGFLGTIAVSCPTTDVTVVVTTNVALTDPLPIARELVALALQ